MASALKIFNATRTGRLIISVAVAIKRNYVTTTLALT